MRKILAIGGAGFLALGAAACAEMHGRNLGPESIDVSTQYEALGTSPTNARPGACYAKVLQPARYETVVERVLDEPGGRRMKIIPATYRTVTERVLVKEETEREVEVPPTYKLVTEEVVVRPEYEKLEVIPPVFKTIREELVVDPEARPARRVRRVKSRQERTVWKAPGQVDREDRVIARRTADGYLLVVEPPTFVEVTSVRSNRRKKVITRKELVEPERTRKVLIPAETKLVTRRVVDEPGGVRVETVPAKFETITRREVVTPEQTVFVDTEDKFRSEPKEILVEGPRVVWSEVLCETDETSGQLRAAQERLFELGFYKGPIDGAFGPGSRNAVEAFQEDRGLATGGLTLETLRALGVRA